METAINDTSYFGQAQKLVPDVFGVLVAFIGVFLTLYFGRILMNEPKVNLADYILFLTLLFIAGTMVVAIWSQKRNEDFRRSSAYLENAISLITQAREVLESNGSLTNDRISWVTAARLLIRAQHIASLITFDAHKQIFEAEHDYQRHIFGLLMKYNDKPLPAAFFCGVDDWSLTIGNAVYHPSQEKNGAKWIPTRIISVVYRFFQYPEGYEDPLDSSDLLNNKELHRLWIFKEYGVCDYFTFRKHFLPMGGEVRSVSNTSVAATATEIDLEISHLFDLDDEC